MESLHPNTELRVQQKATEIRTLVDNGDMNNAILSYHDYIRTIRQNGSASSDFVNLVIRTLNDALGKELVQQLTHVGGRRKSRRNKKSRRNRRTRR